MGRESIITSAIFVGLTTATRKYAFDEMPTYAAIGALFLAGLLRPLFDTRFVPFSEETTQHAEWPYDIVMGALGAGLAYYEKSAIPLVTSVPLHLALSVGARWTAVTVFDSKSLTDGLRFNL